MVFKLSYDANSIKLKEDLETFFKYYSGAPIDFEAYKEDSLKERKKSFKLKGGYSARKTPFGVLIDEKPLAAFYTEANECTLDNITYKINNILSNGNC